MANHFSVYPSSVTANSILFSYDYSNPMWASIKINFWASTESQIQLGYFKVGTDSIYLDNFQLNTNCNFGLTYTNLAKPFATNDNPVVHVFLNGFNVQGSAIQISAIPTKL